MVLKRPLSRPDPFLMPVDTAFKDTVGRTLRQVAIQGSQRTLVLIVTGQSNGSNVLPSLYTPTNTANIHNLNSYDGAFYPVNGKCFGTTHSIGTGNIPAIVADKLITNNRFDVVILVTLGLDGTAQSGWARNQLMIGRVGVAIRRLAARGITPTTAGVTFALLNMIGETDNVLDTSQADFQAAASEFFANCIKDGFSGRIFQPKETYRSAGVDANIQAAQVALVDNVTIFSGGDLDTLTGTAVNRQGDDLHFSDAGGLAAATLIEAAMHASGAPF